MAIFKGRWDFLLAAVLFALALLAQRADLFAALELQSQSFRQILRMADAQRVFPEDKIVFVNQDEAFFEDYGSWPLRRLDLAQVAENVEALGGRVMAVDNLFDFPSSYGRRSDGGKVRRCARALIGVSGRSQRRPNGFH